MDRVDHGVQKKLVMVDGISFYDPAQYQMTRTHGTTGKLRVPDRQRGIDIYTSLGNEHTSFEIHLPQLPHQESPQSDLVTHALFLGHD